MGRPTQLVSGSRFSAIAFVTESGDRVEFLTDPGCEPGRGEEVLRGAVDIDGDGLDEGLMTSIPHEGDSDDYLVGGSG